MDSKDALSKSEGNLPQRAEAAAPPTWSEIGDGFETLGRVGLAMAVGFSAAGLFCRLAGQGKVRVPSLSELIMAQVTQPRSSSPPESEKPAS